ncbi:MAG: 4-hydroxy-3-methylbut-2-enyl diphosphate reductase [Thermotogota bacterium]
MDRAIAMAADVLKQTKPLYVTGDLVHNSEVMDELAVKGLKVIDLHDLPEKALVMIQAHGASPDLIEALQTRGNEIIDGTCPIVKRSFDICKNCSQSSYRLIVFGHSKHPEMVALKGVVHDALIINDLKELKKDIKVMNASNKQNIALCAQTTKPLKEFSEFSSFLSTQLNQFQHLIVYNTICDATTYREAEIKTLASINDCVIVVGGVKSSNTRKLYDIAKSLNNNAHLVHSLRELDAIKENIFRSETCVIASGTSTPMRQVEAVENYITSEMKVDNYSRQ